MTRRRGRGVAAVRTVALAGVCALVLAACAGTTTVRPASSDTSAASASGPTSATVTMSDSAAGRSGATRAARSQPSARSVASGAASPESVRDARDPIWVRIDKMSLTNKVRQLVVAAFSGTTVPTGLIDGLHPGGLIYFSGNMTSQAQARILTTRIQRATRGVTYPMLIMTDQEGGPVTRIPGTEDTPGGLEFHGDADWAHSTAVDTGTLMSGLGINTDLAPVSDVNTAGSGGVIGDRSFGSTPGVVSKLVTAQVCGYHEGGVASTSKHFPGHGSTDTDSHLHTAVIKESVAKWTATDLPPFETAVRDHVDMILVGHLAFPAMDPSGRPATISKKLNGDLLRDRLGYQGVVITDALNMGGITSWGTTGEIAVEAIQAGSDMLLMPPEPSVAVQAVISAVQDGRISPDRLDMSVYRVLKLKQTLGLLVPPKALPHCGS